MKVLSAAKASSRRATSGHPALLFAYAALVAGYLIVCLHQPVVYNAYAGHDDSYFIQSAQSVMRGEWLGDYNQMTMIKGAGFVYFLALNSLLGTSTTLALALLFAGSCALLTRVIARQGTVPPVVSFVLFAGLLLQPALMPNRVIRDSLYQSLFLLVLAGMITLAFDRRSRWRHVRPFMWGLPFGFFWITREEGMWVLPAFGLILIAGVWTLRKNSADRRPFAASVLLFGLAAAIPVLGTSAINEMEYDRFSVTDMTGAGYGQAMQALDTISTGPELKHVTVSMEALRAAYPVSPALRELEVYLDDPENKWLEPGCAVYSDTCGEFGGGWFGWAFRDAAANAGHFASAPESAAFFNEIADDVDEACGDGRLACRSSLLPVGPFLSVDAARKIPGVMVRAARLTAYGEGAVPVRVPSVGTEDLLDDFDYFLGNPRTARSDASFDSGWLVLRDRLSSVYAVVTPIALFAGLFAFAVGLVLAVARRRLGRKMLVIAGIAWVLWLTRLAVIALVDVTASPAINLEYLAPGFLALFVASATSIMAVAPALDELRHRRKPDRSHSKEELGLASPVPPARTDTSVRCSPVSPGP